MNWLAELGGIGNITASGVIILAVILIMRGDLIPRKVHEEVKQERDKWRETAQLAWQSTDRQSDQIDDLIKAQETVVALAEAIQNRVEVDRE